MGSLQRRLQSRPGRVLESGPSPGRVQWVLMISAASRRWVLTSFSDVYLVPISFMSKSSSSARLIDSVCSDWTLYDTR